MAKSDNTKSWSVKNPTGRTKALRGVKGVVQIAPGKSAKVEARWDDAEVAKYIASGLVIEGVKMDALEAEALRNAKLKSPPTPVPTPAGAPPAPDQTNQTNQTNPPTPPTPAK